jgi:transposase-like protein
VEVLVSRVPVTEVADRYGVSRKSVHAWVRRYQESGLGRVGDRSHRSHSQPRQVSAEVDSKRPTGDHDQVDRQIICAEHLVLVAGLWTASPSADQLVLGDAVLGEKACRVVVLNGVGQHSLGVVGQVRQSRYLEYVNHMLP